ncbi:MAG TPA: uroporphyrinogen-III synthase, partial [Reyranella sp.]|nr:uroporphyrinogen-III synthase [Reyranella sp.]
MRVLITRPEREAVTLATALSQRGHVPVIAPLFRLEILHPPTDFSASLAACQAVLLTSANGARALAEASEQRGRPILAVGDTTAATAEGLGFNAVTSAAGDGAALAELVRQHLDPKAGPLLHVSGVDVALDLGETLRPDGFEVRRFALYDAREESTLPDSARAALQARALDAVTFFSPRAASQFA